MFDWKYKKKKVYLIQKTCVKFELKLKSRIFKKIMCEISHNIWCAKIKKNSYYFLISGFLTRINDKNHFTFCKLLWQSAT